MSGGGLLVGQGFLKSRFVGLGQLLVGDLGVCHVLIDLLLARFQIQLFRWRRLGRGALARNRRGGTLFLAPHRRDRLWDRF